MADQLADGFLEGYFRSKTLSQQQKQFQAEQLFKQQQLQQQQGQFQAEQRRLSEAQQQQMGIQKQGLDLNRINQEREGRQADELRKLQALGMVAQGQLEQVPMAQQPGQQGLPGMLGVNPQALQATQIGGQLFAPTSMQAQATRDLDLQTRKRDIEQKQQNRLRKETFDYLRGEFPDVWAGMGDRQRKQVETALAFGINLPADLEPSFDESVEAPVFKKYFEALGSQDTATLGKIKPMVDLLIKRRQAASGIGATLTNNRLREQQLELNNDALAIRTLVGERITPTMLRGNKATIINQAAQEYSKRVGRPVSQAAIEAVLRTFPDSRSLSGMEWVDQLTGQNTQ